MSGRAREEESGPPSPALREAVGGSATARRGRLRLAEPVADPTPPGHDRGTRSEAAARVPRRSSPLRPSTVRRRLVLADVAALVSAFGLSTVVQQVIWPVPASRFWGQILLGVASLPIWLFIASAGNMYVARANARAADEIRRIVGVALVWIAMVIGLAFAVKVDWLSRRWIIITLVAVIVVQVLERLAARMVFARLRRNGRLARPILIAGTDDAAVELARRVRSAPELGYDLVGFVGEGRSPEIEGLPVLGELSRTEQIAIDVGATGVLISLYSVDGPSVNSLARRLTDAGLHVTLSSSLSDIDIRRLRFQQIDRQSLIYIEPVVRTGWRWWAMRTFDYAISIVGLLLTAPIVAAAAIAIKLESPGPVLFRQRRIGQHGREFEMLKLRTMVQNADELKTELLDHNESDGPLFKIKEDPRITRTGRFLRKFSIDELPQFWNVVRGEMSVVGPRPALPSEVEQWDPDLHDRLRVLPGITGIWQVSGRSGTTFAEYKRLDLYYVDNWSLLHDVEIVLRTIGVVLTGRGAS